MSVMTERLTAVRGQLESWDVDALLISSASNRRWLSGFTGSFGYLLVTADQAFLATDSRYWERSRQEAPDFALFKHRRRREDMLELLETAAATRVGIEARHVTLAEMNELNRIDTVTWCPLDNTLEPARQVKTQAEIDAIAAAAAVTDAAMAAVPLLARPGKTERQVAWELEKLMREAGADAMAFSIIVASGPNSALPHHASGERPLQAGDTLVVDMGAQCGGYCSDMTRSFYLGNAPDDRFWNIYNLVLEAETAAIQALRPGITAAAADAVARDIITAAGHGDNFGHGLGHGVGLDIHEAPLLSSRGGDSLIQADMVVTIEPGVYLPGWGGVRIEDLMRVTSAGAEYLSACPKTPVIALD